MPKGRRTAKNKEETEDGNSEQLTEDSVEITDNEEDVENEVSTSTEIVDNIKEKGNDVALQSVPPFNVPCKIIIVFDRARDEMFTHLNYRGESYTPTTMLQRALGIFLQNKNFINSKHEYALMLLNENIATWSVNFTKNVSEIEDKLEELEECQTEDVFNMNSVFDTIMNHVSLPKTDHILQPPAYVVHTIFLYNRSYTLPECEMTETLQSYLKSPYFTFDVLITHEIPEANNYCQKIIDILHNYDRKEKCYFFPVARDAELLHYSMAKFMCHPLQRPKQDFNEYLYVNC